jgi:broad specificity phosphatase PhoE
MMPSVRALSAAVLAVAAAMAARPVAAQQLVVLVRHAERADAVPTNGPMLSSVDPPLSAAGQARAVTLADMLADSGITAIYASEYKRTQDTARPLAMRLGLPVQIAPSAATGDLIRRIRTEQPDGVVLIVGHSNTLPEFLRAFGVRNPPEIAEDDYDRIFVVVPSTGTLLTLHFEPAPPDTAPAG